ncbi:MAG: hypothetical protein ABL995_13715 [Bryobacteraceae bacterium]
MSETKPDNPDKTEDLKEYAGGWMVERKNTDVPPFLKAAYVVIGLSCVTYLIVYMNGEVNHAERGVLVRQFNAATESSSTFMYIVAALGLVYVAATVLFAISKSKNHD